MIQLKMCPWIHVVRLPVMLKPDMTHESTPTGLTSPLCAVFNKRQPFFPPEDLIKFSNITNFFNTSLVWNLFLMWKWGDSVLAAQLNLTSLTHFMCPPALPLYPLGHNLFNTVTTPLFLCVLSRRLSDESLMFVTVTHPGNTASLSQSC